MDGDIGAPLAIRSQALSKVTRSASTMVSSVLLRSNKLDERKENLERRLQPGWAMLFHRTTMSRELE
jgi:hypothetical protein